MSRSPLRDLFRLVHSGLEKVALACAAFGLMHATARAGETAPADVPAGEQWSSHAAPQLAAEDPWSNPATPSPAVDDAWSAPAADRLTSAGQIVSDSPASASEQEPRPAVTKSAPDSVATTVQDAPPALLMDHSDWNETPRGRSPGLIASHDAWLYRTIRLAEPSEPPKAPIYTPPAPPADPWSVPLPGLVASDDVVTPAPAASSTVIDAIDASAHASFVVTPHATLPSVSDAQGALSAEASPTVLAAGRPLHRRTRPNVHCTSSTPRSSGTKRARATRAPRHAWCRSVSASGRHR